ncbi:VirB4 family type IV secretion system protein [Priestia megaterium]|uniref:VirB4 family type IV secretion system protein n=1 Tax=Priestia megaterium TaxID=1404 RepID=UPI0031FDCB61
MFKTIKRSKNTNESRLEFLKQDLSGFKNAIAPSIMKEHSTYMQLGSNYVRTFAIIDYPTKVFGNWLSKLYRFEGNVTISLHMSPDMNSKMINHISNSIEELDSRLHPTKGKPSPKRQRELEQKIKSAEDILDNLMSGSSSSIYYVHMYIHITASSLKELEDLTDQITRKLYSANLRPSVTYDRMKYGFESVLPLANNKLPEWTSQNMDISATSSLMPFDESEIIEESGIIKGRNLTAGSNSFVIVNQHKLKGHNEFVLGMTGAGKSFYLKKDILRYYQQGTRIYVIDPEREYSDLIKAIGGQVITISAMSKYRINPFEILCSNNENDDEEDDVGTSKLHQKLVRIKTFFKLLKKDMTPLEAALVEDMMVQVFADKEIDFDTDFSTLESEKYPILGDLYEKIEEAKEERLKDFQAILKSNVDGSNSLMFNGHTNVNLKSDVICFDLKDMEEEPDSQAAAMFNILSYLWDIITKDRKVWKRLYVDEAHVLADNPRAMKFLFNIYKRIRKYKGGCTAATQQIADFLSATEGKRNYGKAIIGNSQTKMFLTMEPSDIEDIEKHNVVKLSRKEKLLLQSDKKGEGVFIVGKRRVHIKVDHTPFEMKLIDPEQYEKLYGEGREDDSDEVIEFNETITSSKVQPLFSDNEEDLYGDEDEHDYDYESNHAHVHAGEREYEDSGVGDYE